MAANVARMTSSYFDQNNWHSFHLARAKLQTSSKTSALLAGFAMVSMVELHIEKSTTDPALLVVFAVCTSLVVAVHLVALLISTCILPHVDAVANSDSETGIQNSPHTRLRVFVELAWIFSTGFGILLFLCQMVLLAWVRFCDISPTSAIIITTILIPVLILFVVFSVVFYQRLVSFKYQNKAQELSELENDLTRIEHQQNPRSVAFDV